MSHYASGTLRCVTFRVAIINYLPLVHTEGSASPWVSCGCRDRVCAREKLMPCRYDAAACFHPSRAAALASLESLRKRGIQLAQIEGVQHGECLCG